MNRSIQTRHVVVDGVRSPVLIGGTGARGEAVVFVHGNPDAGSDWAPLMELTEPLRAADMDALVVFGADDVYIPVAQAEKQRRIFPRVQIEILPGVGHWAWLEQPRRVAEHVVPFLRERVGQAAQNAHTTRSYT